MSLVDADTGEIVARTLAENEEIIERGLVTFLQVGAALAEIRDAKLYRQRHATFEDYCRERWGWTDNYARKVIAAAEIGTIVPVENEGQARALAPLSGDQDAMRAAFDTATAKAEAEGAKLTAERIKEAVSDIISGDQAEAEHEIEYGDICDECGGNLTHWAGPGTSRGAYCHHCDEEPWDGDDPVGSAPTGGEVEAAADGDEAEPHIDGSLTGATSPKPKPPRLVTVHDFLKPVTSHSWLTGVDPAVFWELDNPKMAETFLTWVDSMAAYAAKLRDNKPNHLRLVEGPA